MNTKHSTLNLTRRTFFKDCGVGTGKIALASLLAGGTNATVSGADDSLAGHVRPHHCANDRHHGHLPNRWDGIKT